MSYILDALKKSEQERKLGHLPGISSEHQNLHQNENNHFIIKLSIIISSILLCLLLILVYLYFYKETSVNTKSSNNLEMIQTEKRQNIQNNLISNEENKAFENHDYPDKQAETSPYETNTMDVIHPSKERREELIRQKEKEEERNAALKIKYEQYFKNTEEKPQSRENQSTLEEAKKIAEETKQQTLQEISGENQKNKEQEASIDNQAKPNNMDTENNPADEETSWQDYPSIAELNPQIQEALPPIHVSTHIYSNAESFRKVTINGQGAKKGAELGKDLILQNISEEGVIVSFKDVWFRMKALENWKK